MADTRPTQVSFFRAVRLCITLLFAPKKLIDGQIQDATNRDNYNTSIEREHSAYIVRRAFLYSFLLVLLSGGIGYGVGLARRAD